MQALQELRTNKLRSALSLTGITIGIFCIIAVLTVIDSLESSIRKRVETLGSDVLYIDKMPPWDGGGSNQKSISWEAIQQRPVMTLTELSAIERNVKGVSAACLLFTPPVVNGRYRDEEVSGFRAYAVTSGFEKIQNLDILEGRYLTFSELDGGANALVIGHGLYESFFAGNVNPIGKSLQVFGRSFRIVGLLKKSGQNVAGFDFDNGIIYPYKSALQLQNPTTTENLNNPRIMAKALPGVSLEYLRDEVTGTLRSVRKLHPGEEDNFTINQLSAVLKSLNSIFTILNSIGWVIGGFSLIVGAFGIANIMFVTVKERTKIIGLKKAIGAKRLVILSEFLVEAIVLCLIGGLIGLLIVFLLGIVMTSVMDFQFALSLKNVVVGLSVSAFVGLLAGMIPAVRASRLDPVVAMRTT